MYMMNVHLHELRKYHHGAALASIQVTVNTYCMLDTEVTINHLVCAATKRLTIMITSSEQFHWVDEVTNLFIESCWLINNHESFLFR